ncbi:class IV lanthionine synthetase LanL [Streptomyces sp. NPDC005500]|uniref:class IV lanthionine synthetase LanL n=1 Tax=Streptomyces sp. NPDC005500 TaxID=3155007 RepID=UPI0033A8A482
MEGLREPDPESHLIREIRTLLADEGHEGWQIDIGASWCRVLAPQQDVPRQGWKLHLSATPLSALTVLSRAAGVLLPQGCSFKFAGTLQRVEELISPQYDRAHAGKFLTVYASGDSEQLRAIAEELHQATEGLAGPRVLSDRPYRPRSLVHYRFGVMRAPLQLSNDGIYQPMLESPNGGLVVDERKAWVAPPPWAPPDPFAGDQAEPSSLSPASASVALLDGRFIVREVIRHAYKGGVFKGIDTRSGGAVVIKRARAHVGATEHGGDVRDVLRHEASMLERFSASGITPHLIALFEEDDSTFMVQEEIAGETLRHWVRHTGVVGSGSLPVPVVVRMGIELVQLMDTVHTQRLVLQDFNPNNIMVQPNGTLRLIDLELVTMPRRQALRGFTVPYGAPEHEHVPRFGRAPEQTADLFSLGVTLFFLVTGVDPTLPPDQSPKRTRGERIGAWLNQISSDNAAAKLLLPLISALLDENPVRRPSLAAVATFLQSGGSHTAVRQIRRGHSETSQPDIQRLIDDGLGHLISSMDPNHARHLWPTTDRGAKTDPLAVQHGAAGTLAVLARALQLRPDPKLRQTVATAADWIRERVAHEPRLLPGLYFGRSGTAWALLDAALALQDHDLRSTATDLACNIPLRWPNPDVCHGMAGAGFTQLRFWELTGEQVFLQRSRQIADALIVKAEDRDGLVLWPIPQDFSSRGAGTSHYGFAHGAAGIGAFLLEAARATGAQKYFDYASATAETLCRVSQVSESNAYWPAGTRDDGRLRIHWCSGSSGVATFLVRMWRHNRDPKLLQLTLQAAATVHRSRWLSQSVVQCHGLAGDAEFLLDVAEAANDPRYRDWAADLAQAMAVRHALDDGSVLLPDETSRNISSSFGVGSAGVLAYLLRQVHGGPRLWLPQGPVDATGTTDNNPI